MRLLPQMGPSRTAAEINADMCKQLWIINMMRSTDSDYHLI